MSKDQTLRYLDEIKFGIIGLQETIDKRDKEIAELKKELHEQAQWAITSRMELGKAQVRITNLETALAAKDSADARWARKVEDDNTALIAENSGLRKRIEVLEGNLEVCNRDKASLEKENASLRMKADRRLTTDRRKPSLSDIFPNDSTPARRRGERRRGNVVKMVRPLGPQRVATKDRRKRGSDSSDGLSGLNPRSRAFRRQGQRRKA